MKIGMSWKGVREKGKGGEGEGMGEEEEETEWGWCRDGAEMNKERSERKG